MRCTPWRQVTWLGLLIPVALGAACVKRPIDYQRELARSLQPSELQGSPLQGGVPPPQPRVLKVRAWVDEDFQAQTPRWHERIADQVRRANRVLEPQFGQRLELVDVVAWQRPVRPPELGAALDQLRSADPGNGVELVLGYVSAVRMPTASMENLGLAELGGRHVVLRAMVLEREYDSMEHALDLLPADERGELARQRRVHREVTILLHEWAHTMGATHESLSASIMADLYHPQAIGFSPESVRLIEDGLRAQADRSSAAPARPPAPPMAPAHPALPPGPGSTPAPLTMVGALPPSLRPVAKAPPPGPRPGPLSPAAQASAATLAERETALQAAGAAPAWLQLARDADRLGAPAVAERAARRASGPAAAALVSDARRARREVALPLEGLVPVAREPEYVRTVNQVLTLVDRRKVSEAGAALRTLAGAFPGSPGLALAECAVAWATGAAQAASSCEAAARLFDEAPRAHLLLGSVHAKSGRWAEARDQFRRALDLDDAVAEPWRRLAGALGKLGQAGPLHDLEARYQAKFGYALRPVGD